MPFAARSFVASILAVLCLSAPVRAQAPAVLATAEINTPGVVAEMTECKRKQGVLSLKLRFRNTTAEGLSFNALSRGNYQDFYVVAGTKKYFVLRDTESTPLAPPQDPGGAVSVSLPAGGTWTWWAKYPAPPAELKSITYFTPVGPPIEDIPITDL